MTARRQLARAVAAPSAARMLQAGLGATALRAALGALALCALLPAQGAILDVLDGETLYDGGFLFTLGQEWQRRERLRNSSDHVADPQARHELERGTTMGLQYGLRHDLQLGIAISWQHTDSVAAGAEAHADGFGDLELLAKYRFLRLDDVGVATNFAVLGGVTLPTGDDDQRSGGVELPPELQPGSGGIDPMFGVAVTHEPGRWRFNAATMLQLHTDSDGDGDRPGDELVVELAAGNRFWLEPYPGPFMRLDLVLRYYREDHDHMDGTLPDTGGERGTVGLNYAFRPRPSLDFQLYVEAPYAQHVNGTQLGDDWRVDVTFGYRF